MTKAIVTLSDAGIPAMTPRVVHDYLRYLGRTWSGIGCAVEFGSWLGATAVPLLEGLTGVGYDRPFYAYDLWKASEKEVEKARKCGVNIVEDQDLRPLFVENVKRVHSDVVTVKGSITRTLNRWPYEAVEFCILDAPKRNPCFKHVIDRTWKHWIPGVTVIGFLDFYWYRNAKQEHLREQRRVAERMVEQAPKVFTRLAEWPDECSCAFFRYEGGKFRCPGR